MRLCHPRCIAFRLNQRENVRTSKLNIQPSQTKRGRKLSSPIGWSGLPDDRIAGAIHFASVASCPRQFSARYEHSRCSPRRAVVWARHGRYCRHNRAPNPVVSSLACGPRSNGFQRTLGHNRRCEHPSHHDSECPTSWRAPNATVAQAISETDEYAKRNSEAYNGGSVENRDP